MLIKQEFTWIISNEERQRSICEQVISTTWVFYLFQYNYRHDPNIIHSFIQHIRVWLSIEIESLTCALRRNTSTFSPNNEIRSNLITRFACFWGTLIIYLDLQDVNINICNSNWIWTLMTSQFIKDHAALMEITAFASRKHLHQRQQMNTYHTLWRARSP
jgi:hypothetical protein